MTEYPHKIALLIFRCTFLVCVRVVLIHKMRLAPVLDEVFQPLRRTKTACRFSTKLSAGNTNKLRLVLPGTIRPLVTSVYIGALWPLYLLSKRESEVFATLLLPFLFPNPLRSLPLRQEKLSFFARPRLPSP